MANRKLQGEIDRVLKKVDEGVHVFEQIWDKVYSATTTAQKEKYEGDLKKEIKKLQRLRDQIKTWQGDSSIKDKSRLDSNRKLIEEKMEKFKICEKETKTKAFSKEGLAQDRTDPKQKAKAGVEKWIQEAINKLHEQSDEIEAEIESMNSGKRKKRGEENPRVTQLKEHRSRHEHHVTMLERVLRAVTNETVSPEEAAELKESVDYYIESNQDPDFFEDDEMYDTLNLNSAPVPAATKKGARGQNREREREKDNEEEETDISNIAPPAIKKPPVSPRATKSAKVPNNSTTTSPRPGLTTISTGRVASPKSNRDDISPTLVTPHSPRSGSNSVSGLDPVNNRSNVPPLLSSVVKGAATKPGQKPAPVTVLPPDLNGRQQPLQKPGEIVIQSGGGPPVVLTHPIREAPQAVVPSTDDVESVEPSYAPQPDLEGLRTASEDANVDKIAHNLNPTDPNLAAVEAALSFMPEAATASRKPATPGPPQKQAANDVSTPSHAAPRNPIQVPPSFPNVSAPVFDSREVFEQFDPDTLFFIFYYQQGTYQQYLAATELKRQGWRFHKKYLTWFQRHDEPKMSTDKYETGTFIYFDYANFVVQGQGTGWCQRIKSEFVFEYRFLEDELV